MMDVTTDCGRMVMIGVGVLAVVLFLVIRVVGFAILRKGEVGRTNPSGSSGEESPLDILKRRYARGELTKQEFEERKSDLLA